MGYGLDAGTGILLVTHHHGNTGSGNEGEKTKRELALTRAKLDE